MPTATHTAMGYRATKTDGELVVHRVPIFCACERGDHQFDERWIKAAIDHALQQQREGYMPPLHTRHHEASTEATNAVQSAGHFKIVGSGPITLKGNRRTAILADLIITDEFVASEVLRKKYPYRSVEIFNVDEPAIDSLALLDHEAPFLELPMLMVADVDDKTETNGSQAAFSQPWTMETRDDGGPIVGSLRQGKKATLLFRSQETDMPEKDEKTVAEEINDKVKATNFAEDDKTKDDKPKGDDDKDKGANMEEGGLDVSSVVKAIESGEISIADMDAILAAIQGQGKEAEVEDEEMPAPAPTPGQEAMKKEPIKMTEKMAAMAGENEALKMRMDERDAADTRKTDVGVAMKRLEGRPLGSDVEEKFAAFHKEHGAKAFADYVDSIAKTFGALPSDGKGFHGTADKGSKVAMKYAEQGADAITRAEKFCAEWDQLQSSGIQTSQEAYVKHNMERAQSV